MHVYSSPSMTLFLFLYRQCLLGELFDRGVSRDDIERTLACIPFVSQSVFTRKQSAEQKHTYSSFSPCFLSPSDSLCLCQSGQMGRISKYSTMHRLHLSYPNKKTRRFVLFFAPEHHLTRIGTRENRGFEADERTRLGLVHPLRCQHRLYRNHP